MALYLCSGPDSISDTGRFTVIVQAPYMADAQLLFTEHLLSKNRLDLEENSVVVKLSDERIVYSNVEEDHDGD